MAWGNGAVLLASHKLSKLIDKAEKRRKLFIDMGAYLCMTHLKLYLINACIISEN